VNDPIELALAQAQQSLRLSQPNPRVGCVLVDAGGTILGQGHTQQAGGPHAEIMALRDAAARGHSVQGATAYVTLEPCSHHGRTGPCCEALVAAGVARVVASLADPNPLVSGRGFARLRAAGVQVEVGPGANPSRELNIGFFSRMVRGLPWVRMKVAASLDGVTALDNGASQWITGEAARTDGHAWRARACAILTGIGTVRDDDPQLNVRDVATTRQPLRVLIDSRLEVNPAARLFSADGGRVLVIAAQPDEAKAAVLRERGAEVVFIPNDEGKTELMAVMQELGRRGINELHVEAGTRLNGSLLREGCVDELLVYLAPSVLGDSARGMFSLAELTELDQRTRLVIRDTAMTGGDVRIIARLEQGAN
jgi:diaminohydroxyphosphoribosylaminopyrimidine deaminase/5-amino-6-(5-phosphoribosylamino)uracil reductase